MQILARCLLGLGVIVTTIFALMSHPPAIIGVDSDPTKHALGLAIVMILAKAAFPKAKLTTLALLSAVGSLVIEVLQGVPPFHRDPDVVDWLAGMGGVLLSLAPLAVFQRVVKARSR